MLNISILYWETENFTLREQEKYSKTDNLIRRIVAYMQPIT